MRAVRLSGSETNCAGFEPDGPDMTTDEKIEKIYLNRRDAHLKNHIQEVRKDIMDMIKGKNSIIGSTSKSGK